MILYASCFHCIDFKCLLWGFRWLCLIFYDFLVIVLQVIGTCLRLRLQDKHYLERVTGLNLNHQQTDTLRSLADCVYYVLINTKGTCIVYTHDLRIIFHIHWYLYSWIHFDEVWWYFLLDVFSYFLVIFQLKAMLHPSWLGNSARRIRCGFKAKSRPLQATSTMCKYGSVLYNIHVPVH